MGLCWTYGLVTEIEDQFDVMLDTDDIIAMSSFEVTKTILVKKGVNFDVVAR